MSNVWQPTGFNFQIQSTADYGINNGCKVVVYGKAGYGKTRLCATAPRPFVISAESGVLSLRDYGLPYVAVYSIAQLREVQRWCFGSVEARQYATFCIDSASEIAEQTLMHEKSQTKNTLRAYGEMADEIMILLKQFRDWQGPNVYFTAKQETSKDNNQIMYSRPSFPGQQLPNAVPYFPDEIFQMLVGKDNTGQPMNYLRCWPDQFSEAKDRSGKLREFEPANLSYIFDRMMGRA